MSNNLYKYCQSGELQDGKDDDYDEAMNMAKHFKVTLSAYYNSNDMV